MFKKPKERSGNAPAGRQPSPAGKVRDPRREAAFPCGEGKGPPPGGRLPLRGRWTGRSPGRRRGKTLSWERVAGRSPDGCGAVPRTNPVPPLFRRCGGTFPQGKVRKRPRRRKPSPTGKVDRAQPGPDEGKQPKNEEQATLNGSPFHSTWPVSLLGYGPSSVTPYGVPPSP